MDTINVNVEIDKKEIQLPLEDAVYYSVINMDINIDNLKDETLKAIILLKRSEVSRSIKNTPYFEGEYRIGINKSKENERLKKLVYETQSEIVVNNNKLVECFFTDCCSGATSNSEDIIDRKIGYLRRVFCDFCNKDITYERFSIENSEEENSKKLSYIENTLEIFKNIERDEVGRIKSINFLGRKLTGREFMEALNLKSSRVYFRENVIDMKVLGAGHGLGLCIDGANSMAMKGKSYRDIIEYYYTGIEFQRLGEEMVTSLSGKVIILDPGHGGRDYGNIRGNIQEKNITLLIAKKVKTLLENKRATVYLTRSKDTYISLTDRVDIANKIKPNFFISIHLNDFWSSGVNGCEALCYREDIEAIELSNEILNEIEKNSTVKKRRVGIGDYFALRECKVSSIILECLYITGNIDVEYLEEESLNKIAYGIYKGICNYYNLED